LTASGPLAGLRVVEFASIGPGPHCAMLFADMGAEVLRIERAGGNGWPNPIVDRGRATLSLDIRTDDGRATAIEAVAHADILIEGLRPGVMERLGLGPDEILKRNPRLIYGRMTGWGQEGPLARIAGHDITYIALTGALAAIGKPGEPAAPPLNLVGDFGGGSMFLAFGILSALYERERSGLGQVVDAAIIDGVNSMMTMFAGLLPTQRISLERDQNLLGGAAPFYRTYICQDGKEIAVGALEPQFFAIVREKLKAPDFVTQNREDWDKSRAWFAKTFASKPRDHWAALFEGTDGCVGPVLTMDEIAAHPHHAARGSFVEGDPAPAAAPAPRFSRTPGAVQDNRDGAALLAAWRAAPLYAGKT
jgi:alpha-methylacyl-CoA racemase